MNRPQARPWTIALALTMTMAVCAPAQARDRATATVTILAGPATVIHAASKLGAAEGAVLEAEDIIETTDKTTFVRLELDSGTIVDIGPSSRVMLRPPGAAMGEGAVAYLLEGWLKLSVSKPANAAKGLLLASVLDVSSLEREAVLHIKANGEAGLFATSGAAQAMVRNKAGKATSMPVGKGAFLARAADGGVDTSARPSQAFIQAVPRAFMDTLPSRMALFKDKDVRLTATGKLSYADTQAWLNAEPRVRTLFLKRWRPLLQDEGFKHALAEQLSLHPEWHHILYPPPPRPKATAAP